MNNLQVFINEKFGQVRVSMLNGEPWFVALDVCQALDIINAAQAIGRLDADEKGICLNDTLGGKQNLAIVNEAGLYSLVLGSRKPSTREFKRWITHEILPTIRKTGGYVANEEMFVEQYFPEADPALKLVLSTALRDKKKYMAQLRAQRPLVDFAETIQTSEDNILMGTLAKLICNSGTKIGAKRLFKLLRDEKILMENNVPYQHYIDQGYFVVKESAYTLSCDTVKLKPTTLITPKGQVWVVNRVRKALGE